MALTICLLDCALGELFADVSTTRCMTIADRYGLLAAVLDETLSDDDRRSVDRLLRAVKKGRIELVNEISTLRRA